MASTNKPPRVFIARPGSRPFQLRYVDPHTGRKVRISTGTRDENEAERQRSEVEAKLRLGIPAQTKRKATAGKYMAWEDFRERYSTLQLSTLRDRSIRDSEGRLDIIERILKPRTLADIADSEALHDLQTRLLNGEQTKTGNPRSPHTVRTYMAVVIAALNWASYMGWLEHVPRVRKAKVSKLRHMKGRPITLEEFERMLAVIPVVVGEEVAESWRYVLRGLWESGLRIGELMDVSWDDSACIMPVWRRGALPVLAIPAAKQKNATEEAIPLLPGFEALLLETPESERTGYVFNPGSLQVRLNRPIMQDRSSDDWVAKAISRIGKKAGVIVQPATKTSNAKYASAHDLRRACAERLISAGVPEREVTRIMRHSSIETTRRYYAPGSVQTSAGILRQYLGTQEQRNQATWTCTLKNGVHIGEPEEIESRKTL